MPEHEEKPVVAPEEADRLARQIRNAPARQPRQATVTTGDGMKDSLSGAEEILAKNPPAPPYPPEVMERMKATQKAPAGGASVRPAQPVPAAGEVAMRFRGGTILASKRLVDAARVIGEELLALGAANETNDAERAFFWGHADVSLASLMASGALHVTVSPGAREPRVLVDGA